MEEEKKNKLKKILSYIGCGIGCFILGLCVSNCANNKGKKASNVNNNTQNEVVQNVEHKNIQFNDVDETIIFDVYDLNSCSYPNLISLLNSDENIDFTDTFISYNGNVFTFNYYGAFDSLQYSFSGYMIQLSLDETYGTWIYSDSLSPLFESDIQWNIQIMGSVYYESVKSVIQKDIEYNNQQYQQSIFGGLTESLVDFIGVIGSGFTSVFTIFYANGHITTFGTLSLIVVGVAIAYFLFRFIIGLIRLRG